MEHFYRDIPGLGHVAVSRHAQARIEEQGISQRAFEAALFTPAKTVDEDNGQIQWRETNGVRVVLVMFPTPNRGARVVKTVFKIGAQAGSREAVSRLKLKQSSR